MKIQKRWSRGAVAFGAAAVALAAAGCSDGSGLNGPQGVGDTAMPVAAPAPANPLPLGGSDEAGDAAADDLSAELAAQQAEKARLEQTIAELGRKIEELKEAQTEERGDEDDDERGTDRRTRRTIADLEEQLEKAREDLKREQEKFDTAAERVNRLREENDTLRAAAEEPPAEAASSPATSAPEQEEPEELLKDASIIVNFSEIEDASEIDEGGILESGYPKEGADFLCVLFFTEATFNAKRSDISMWEANHNDDDDDNCDEMKYKECTSPLDLADGFTCYDLGPCDGDEYPECNDRRSVSVADPSVKVEDITRFAVLMNGMGGFLDDNVNVTITTITLKKDGAVVESSGATYEPNDIGLYWPPMQGN